MAVQLYMYTCGYYIMSFSLHITSLMYVCWSYFSATLYLYEQAVILLSNATGPISLTKSDIKSASFFDAVSTCV